MPYSWPARFDASGQRAEIGALCALETAWDYAGAFAAERIVMASYADQAAEAALYHADPGSC